MATRRELAARDERNGEWGFDLIGDVHGHAGELRNLLAALGYEEGGEHGAFSHPNRRAIFVGDLIDRGPEIAETVEIVLRMTVARSAACGS